MPNNNEETSDDPTRTSSTGVPAAGAVVRDRFSSDEIFQRIVAAADEEITSTKSELFFSGLAAGLAITITFLAYASLYASTGHDPILSVLLYPVGFIFIILGGYQLYTENTLPPVALTLERFASLPLLFRHWLIVLSGNFVGGALGAVVLALTGVLPPESAQAALEISEKGLTVGWWTLFFKGTLAGLIVAGVVWVEYASRDTISRLIIIYLAFLLIPLCNLFHVVVSFTELVFLYFAGDVVFLSGLLNFVAPVLLGNTAGGVVLVTLINYYQTSENRLGSLAGSTTVNRLTLREWFLGGFVGRAHVPFIAHHGEELGLQSDYRLMIPLRNPDRERPLVELACLLCEQHEAPVLQLVHILPALQQKNLNYRGRRRERLLKESQSTLSDLEEEIEPYDVTLDTSTVFSHNPFEEIFTQARQENTDTVLMNWKEDRVWDTVRTGRLLDELTTTLPCDFLVLKDQELDTSDILLPTAGGPDSDLSAEVAAALQQSVGSDVTILHVVDSEEHLEQKQEEFEQWAQDKGLEDTEIIVDGSGDIEGALAREAENHTLVIVGATERGLLSRLARGTLHFNVVNELDASVLMAERPSSRSIFQLIFGS